MGLPPFYKTFVVTLDATPTHNLTLDNVILHMLNEESRTIEEEDNTQKLNDEVLSVTQVAIRHLHRLISEIICFKCGKKGYYQLNCSNIVLNTRINQAANLAIENDDDSF